MSKLLILVTADPGFDPEPLISYVKNGVNFTEVEVVPIWFKKPYARLYYDPIRKILMADEAWVVSDQKEPRCVKSRTRVLMEHKCK